MVLGAVILFIGGRPLINYAVSKADMMIVKGAPENRVNEGKLLKPFVKSSTLEKGVIRKPAINTQYGTISCSQTELAAPLYYGDSSYSLQNGAGQYSKSGFPGEGKPVLVGGHDATFFSSLKNIKKGDIIKIVTTYGKFEYQVTGFKVADRNDTRAYDLTKKKEQLILYTCYPFGQLIGDRSKRYFVYSRLKSYKIEAE